MPAWFQGRAISGAAVLEPPEPEIEGWQEIVLPGANLTAGGNCFGSSCRAVVDPTNPARVWMAVDLQGVWKSEDYGKPDTWVHIASTGIITEGKIWTLAISCDGVRLWAGSGAGDHFLSCLTSTDGGYEWVAIATGMAFEAYRYEPSPTNPDRVMATAHYPGGEDGVFESQNAGADWVKRSTGYGDTSGYPYYGLTDDTVLYIAQGDTSGTGGTRRATRSGGAIGVFSAVDTWRHNHGAHQLYVDRVNGLIWNPSAAGIKVSDDDGETWTQVSSVPAQSIIRSRGILMAGNSYATQGTLPGGPRVQEAAYPDGETFTERTDEPAEMENGPVGMDATVNPAGQDIFFFTNWVAPIYRFVGPVV